MRFVHYAVLGILACTSMLQGSDVVRQLEAAAQSIEIKYFAGENIRTRSLDDLKKEALTYRTSAGVEVIEENKNQFLTRAQNLESYISFREQAEAARRKDAAKQSRPRAATVEVALITSVTFLAREILKNRTAIDARSTKNKTVHEFFLNGQVIAAIDLMNDADYGSLARLLREATCPILSLSPNESTFDPVADSDEFIRARAFVQKLLNSH